MSQQKSRRQNGVKLPFALRKELGLPDGKDREQSKRRNGGSRIEDRKERRKTVRVEKRRGATTPRSSQIQVHEDSEDEEDEEQDDHIFNGQKPLENVTEIPKSKPPRAVKPEQNTPHPKSILKQTKREPRAVQDLNFDQDRDPSPDLVLDPNSRAFRQHAEEDDAEIAALERKLGIKSKNKTKLGDDMLDFVLEGLDEETEVKKRKRESQDWLDQKRRKVANNAKDDSDENEGSTDNDEIDGFDEDDVDDETMSELDDEDRTNDLANGLNYDEELDEHSFDGFESESDVGDNHKPVQRVRENPYVAPVVSNSIPGKYIPPSLRKKLESDSSSLESLRRQLQGQLNKLSEANIISILSEIEKIYRTNPRQDVTTVLVDLILTTFCVRSALQNTFIILHVAFLAAVYKVMGTDVGAELLVKVVERFDQEYKAKEDAGKEALNLISLLANLFTFNVASSHIIYDHIRLLLSDFSETNAELLLRVVRDCGPQLRSDDPAALKGIVQTLQEISGDMAKTGEAINIRTRVMMDAITDLKNNKMKNATNAAGITGEHITRMRKALGSLNSRALKATEPLRLTREDIANSDKKGKWWLVGASWKGNQQNEQTSDVVIGDDLPAAHGTTHPEDELDLLALAKQYRMNTDVRRSIFVAIVSANDCRDAQLRMSKLRLSTKQEQEIAKVLLQCARAEPAYNPYYTLLAKDLCKDNKKVRMGFQFGLWDFFGKMGEKADADESDGEREDSPVEMHEVINIAKMFAYLIFHGHLTIGVLKTLNIGFLQDQATMFLELLLISIMTQPNAKEEELIKVFSKATDTPQITKSLQYFLKKNVRKSDLISKKDKDRVKEGCRIADLALKIAGSSQNVG